MTLVRSNEANALVQLNDQALRVRAIQAAHLHDADLLVTLTQGYMATASRKAGRSRTKTLQAYGLAIRDFVNWAKTNGVNLLKPSKRSGGQYIAWLQNRDNQGNGKAGRLSAATVAQYVAGVRALYRALSWAGATEAQPFAQAYTPVDPTPGIVKNPPYQQEIDDVLRCCEPRLAALLLLCAHAGLRIGEALDVRASDLSGTQLIVRGKGGKVRRVPLGLRVRQALSALEHVQEDGRFFGWNYAQATYRMQKAFKKAGHAQAWRGFHAARKHSGTRLYQATKDFTRVGLFLGHSSVDTTRRYVAVADDDVSAEVEHF